MKKEIHRMELRRSGLDRTKEQLIKELERSIEKRDSIFIKGRANMANSKKQGGKLMEQQLLKKCEDLQRSITDTEAECAATNTRISTMDRKRRVLAKQMELLAMRCGDLRNKDLSINEEVQVHVARRTALLLQAERLHAAATALEEVHAGQGETWLPLEGDGLTVFQEKVHSEQQAIKGVVERLGDSREMAPLLRRTLFHIDALKSL
jgi:chromosome segregation ATPase